MSAHSEVLDLCTCFEIAGSTTYLDVNDFIKSSKELYNQSAAFLDHENKPLPIGLKTEQEAAHVKRVLMHAGSQCLKKLFGEDTTRAYVARTTVEFADQVYSNAIEARIIKEDFTYGT